MKNLARSKLLYLKVATKKPQLDLTIEHRPCPVILKEEIETLIKYGEGLIENEIAAEKEERKNKERIAK